MNSAKTGIILIDKPLDITSRQALFNVQKKLNYGRLGHTGTLDPLATGLLVLLCGQARKLQDILTLDTKEYEVRICLGATSETDDREGPIHPRENITQPTLQQVQVSVNKFLGEIEQIPPRYSAIKIQGKRAYKRAREGENVVMPSRKVQIHTIDLIAYEYPYITLKVYCGSGTYIRSLARDIGEDLGVGGYVVDLRRTKVGDFSIEHAATMEDATALDMLSLEDVLQQYPRIDLEKQHLLKICHGQKISFPEAVEQEHTSTTFLWIENRVVAIAKIGNGFVASRKLLIADQVP